MDALQMASDLSLYTIIVTAVAQDFCFMKISNRLILVGLAVGSSFRLISEGSASIVHILVNIIFPVIVLYLLFLLGAIGAGDIKLFSVVGSFINFRQLVACMVLAFLMGAALSLGKMIQNGNLLRSIDGALYYFQELFQGKLVSYDRTQNGEKNLIHFSVAICLGLFIAKGGV